MTKEKVLRLAREEGKDEMALQARDRSMKWTYIVMVLCAAVFAVLRARQGLPVMDLCATVCYSVSAGFLYRYAKMREKNTLVLGVVQLMIGIAATVRYFGGH